MSDASYLLPYVREYGDGHWRATFYVTGHAHSIVGGSAWEPKAWTAVQRAAWIVLRKPA